MNIEKELKEQISKLKKETLEITNQIETFRNEGDVDNVGISNELQDRLELLSSKITKLQKNLAIYKDSKKSNNICIGKTIKLTDEKRNKEITLVLPEDADSRKGLISYDSPLGKALINKDEGEKVLFKTPAGDREFDIAKIQ